MVTRKVQIYTHRGENIWHPTMHRNFFLVLMTSGLHSRWTRWNQNKYISNATQNFNLSCFYLYMKPFFPDFILQLSEAAALESRIHLFRPFSHHQTVFTENVQWRVTCYFHFILSRKKNHTAVQERLNSTKATFQLSPKTVVQNWVFLILMPNSNSNRKGASHRLQEQNMQVLEKDNFSFPSKTKETDLNTTKPALKVSSSL